MSVIWDSSQPGINKDRGSGAGKGRHSGTSMLHCNSTANKWSFSGRGYCVSSVFRIHNRCLFFTPSTVRLFPTGKADYNPYIKNNCCLLLSKNLQANCKSHIQLFPRFKGFAAIRNVLYLLQLFALMSKIQNSQIQNSKSFLRIKGNVNILHPHILKPLQCSMQKNQILRIMSNAYKTHCKESILICR